MNIVFTYIILVKFSDKPEITQNINKEESKIETHGRWLTEITMKTKHPLVRLQNEIMDFNNYMVFTKEEIAQHNEAIELYMHHIKIE